MRFRRTYVPNNNNELYFPIPKQEILFVNKVRSYLNKQLLKYEKFLQKKGKVDLKNEFANQNLSMTNTAIKKCTIITFKRWVTNLRLLDISKSITKQGQKLSRL